MKRIITHYFIPAVTFLVLVSVIAIRCKKPTEGINVIVNTSSLFHYTALVQIVDPSGGVPNNLSVAVSGPGAAAIYGIDGKKALYAPAGIIALAVHPKMEPTASAPLTFNLTITGPGYLTLVIPVTISATQNSQIIKASILNLTTTTAGVSSTSSTAAAVAGTVATATVVSTPTTSGPESTTVTIPAGTKVQDANGATIAASSVSVTVNNFSAATGSTIGLFPGGSLSSNNVIGSGGATTPVTFLPAGFVNVEMTAGGTPVKKFSAPINLQMTLDPAYKNVTTGATVKAGDVLGIYSYSTDTGQWKFEQNATVTASGGNLVVNFTSTHLTQFFAGETMALLAAAKVNITAPWYLPGNATNITMIATLPNGPAYPISQVTFQLDATLAVTLDGKIPVPTVAQPVLLSFYSSTNTLIGTATLTTNGGSYTVTLSAPAANPAVTLSLILNCSQSKKGLSSVIPPDFYLLYKPTGQPAANYALLGQVQNGKLTTTQLAAGTGYDFKAVFNNSVKEVINHTVAENIPANQTVGGNGFSGNRAAAQNRIDINALCDSF